MRPDVLTGTGRPDGIVVTHGRCGLRSVGAQVALLAITLIGFTPSRRTRHPATDPLRKI